MGEEDWARFREGIELFNAGSFWHAHEAWEAVWRRKTGDCTFFFKGLIQAAAAYHQLEQGKFRGMMTHFDNARAKLVPFAPEYLGVRVDALLESLDRSRHEAERLGKTGLQPCPRTPVARIEFAPS